MRSYACIGVHLNEAREYGANYIDSLSQDIRREYPEVKWANARNLRYMAKFARETEEEILHTVYAELSRSHNKVLMDRVKNCEVRLWYARSSIEGGWSKVVLDHQNRPQRMA
jgi:predicted nuclease of restriction endonuclease-like (RecB) superfamily